MQKTLTITIHQDPTQHVEKFINDWHQFGSVELVSELVYKLVGPGDKTSHLTMDQYEIKIEGQIPSVSFMLIDTLSKACEADKVIEGEVIDKNQTSHSNTSQPYFEELFGNQSGGTGFKMPMGMNSMIKISGMSKFKVILLLVLALPLLIIMIPIVIIISIIKIILFKIKYR